MGKIGRDIEDKKLSWLLLQSLKYSNNEEKEILFKNYGFDDVEKVTNIKNLFKKLDLQQKFLDYEELQINHILELVDDIKDLINPTIFKNLLNMFSKRKK
jgi:farnesyl diphosphate synthase